MLTYNALLYTERQKRKLSRRKMAKLLKIWKTRYLFLENGYLKPTKREIAKISSALEIDYSQYMIGELSYPSEMPEKKRNPVVKFFYKVIGTITFKVIFAVLAGLSVGFMISGFAVEHNTNINIRYYQEEEYLNFFDRLKENGSIHLSATSELTSPEYRHYEKDEENQTSKYISIVGSYNDKNINTMSFTATYRRGNSRLVYSIISYASTDGVNDISAKYTEYDTAITATTSIIGGKIQIGISYMDSVGNKSMIDEGDEKYQTLKDCLLEKIDSYEQDFNDLISEKDPTFAPDSPNKMRHLIDVKNKSSDNLINPTAYSFLGRYFGIIISGINLFILAYSLLYGTTKKGEKIYKTTVFEVPVDEVHRMKSDIKITPFIPETLLEIVGIILVFIGSFRLIFYVAAFLTGNSSAVISTTMGADLMQIFMAGMFLLYFIDFDVFLDDKRVLRNIVLYTIVFFCLYGLENLLYRTLHQDSVIGQLMSFVTMPNMFGSIAGYYLIMLFLFFTPSFLKKKYQIIIYRCLSIFPAAAIFTAWYLYNGYNVLFDAKWSTELRNLFNAERIPFSILAVTYLYFLYFIRLFFVWRLGKQRAAVFFNGNKFLWIKNIMVSLIILAIGLVEFALKDNLTAHKLGLGMNYNILFLIPLLFFYHPHKGPRNIVLDWTTLFFYIFAISFAYVAVVILVLIKLLV